MTIEFEIKAVQVSGSLRMTIPLEIRRALAIKPGDTLIVTLSDDVMQVKKRA